MKKETLTTDTGLISGIFSGSAQVDPAIVSVSFFEKQLPTFLSLFEKSKVFLEIGDSQPSHYRRPSTVAVRRSAQEITDSETWKALGKSKVSRVGGVNIVDVEDISALNLSSQGIRRKLENLGVQFVQENSKGIF